MKIRRALISVSDKSGIEFFAKALSERGVELLSTGGTHAAIAAAGVPVREVSEHTGFPEMMDGRVKTLHPKVHGGILALRDETTHVEAMEAHGIGAIDLVIVNLYPFEATVAKPGTQRAEAVEQIDIGGPSMVRSAAKNHRFVGIVTDPDDYARVLSDAEDHPDVDEVHHRAVAIDARISLATVYRTLRLFEDSGIIQSHVFGGPRSRYEATDDDDHHDLNQRHAALSGTPDAATSRSRGRDVIVNKEGFHCVAPMRMS